MELISLYSSVFCINVLLLDSIECASSNTTNASIKTTLAPNLELMRWKTAYILAATFVVVVPVVIYLICCIRAAIAHGREKKVTDDNDNADDDDEHFQHPPPSHPAPRLFRGGTIAGPFSNPAFDADDDGRSDVVTPSFISTRVVETDTTASRRYQYIP